MTCRAVRGYVAGREDFEYQPGLPADVNAALTRLLDTNRNLDDNKRLQTICAAVKTDAIPGLSESVPDYVPKGLGSWKYKATGLQSDDDSGDRPSWGEAFEKSDYRRFHDAVKRHRFVTTQEILPACGLRIA